MKALLLIIATSVAAQQQEGRPTDARIQGAVERHLALEETLPAKEVTVAVDDGIVTLVGTAPHLLAKERAVQVVENLKGVVGIVDRLTVGAAEVPDDRLQADVEAALLADPAADSYEIAVTAKDGRVTLEGSVQSFAEKELAAEVASGVEGVRSLDNRLLISKGRRTDADLMADVKGLLISDPFLNGEVIRVGVDGSSVTLEGAVGTLAQARRAQRAAWLAGAEFVSSDFDIEWWREDMRRSSAALRTDEQIEHAIRRALALDPRVYAYNIGVEATDGTVTLTGLVDNARSRTAAEKDAKNAVGAWRIRNHIQVRPESMPDDFAVQKSVEDALRKDVVLRRRDIDVGTRNNAVTLRGMVRTAYERRRAEDVAASRAGVVSVENRLTVRPPALTPPGDSRLEASIEDQLFWSLYVDADDVEVAADRGTVVLSGDVGSWQEHQAAVKNAFDGGATRVISRMSIDGDQVAATFGPEGYIIVD